MFLRQRIRAQLTDAVPVLLAAGIAISTYSYIEVVPRPRPVDFAVYYGAGQRILAGLSPYATYGEMSLPFQAVPWTAWAFAPLALLPYGTAWIAYVIASLASLAVALLILRGLYAPGLRPAEILMLGACTVFISQDLFIVGQLGFLLLLATTLIVFFLVRERPVAAGLLVPFLLSKPQLFVIFIPALLLRGGRRFVMTATASLLVLLTIAAIFHPEWPVELAGVLRAGQLRAPRLPTTFATLPSFFGLSRWEGYALAPLLLAFSAGLLYGFRKAPLLPWITMALTLSVFSAPYSFAYDLPLLVPALLYLTPRLTLRSLGLWLAVMLLAWLAPFVRTASIAILLVTAALVVTQLLRQGVAYVPAA